MITQTITIARTTPHRPFDIGNSIRRHAKEKRIKEIKKIEEKTKSKEEREGITKKNRQKTKKKKRN